MTGSGQDGKTPVQVVFELTAAICDDRTADMLALVDPQVDCMPLVRPGLSAYQGHDGMICLASDLHAVHGNYRVEIASVTEQAGPQVTMRARLVPGPGRGQPQQVTIVYTFRAGLVKSIESFPAGQEAAIPAPGQVAPGPG